MGKFTTECDVPAYQFQTVEDICPSTTLCFGLQEDVATIAAELLATHTLGAPVVDEHNQLFGVIYEFDILRAYISGIDLGSTRASDILTTPPFDVPTSTTLSHAMEIMDDNHLLILPITQDGGVLFSITRHDLLRAILGLVAPVEKP